MAGPLHFQLTRRVDGWLASRRTGCGSYTATEVYLAEGYVADAVAIASFQHRFWVAVGGKGHIVPERLSIIFETKVSRGDLLSTFSPTRNGNRRSPIGNLHYLIVADGLSCADCLPDWWGILKQSGRGLREIRPARFCEITDTQLYHAAFRVLLASHRNPIREFITPVSTNDLSA